MAEMVDMMRACKTRDQRLALAQQAVDAVCYALDSECGDQSPILQAAYESCRALGHLLAALQARKGG